MQGQLHNNFGKINGIANIATYTFDEQKETIIIIRNILKNFHLVEGDWSDCKTLIKAVGNNEAIKNIIYEEISSLYANQLETNQENYALIKNGREYSQEIYKKAIGKLSDKAKRRIELLEFVYNDLHQAIAFGKQDDANKLLTKTIPAKINEIYKEDNSSINGTILKDALAKALYAKQTNIAKLIIETIKKTCYNECKQTLKKVLLYKNEEDENALQFAINEKQADIAKHIIEELKNINDNGQALKEAILNENVYEENALEIAQEKNLKEIVYIINANSK